MSYATQVPSFENIPSGLILEAILETERAVVQALLVSSNQQMNADERIAARDFVLNNVSKASVEINRYAGRGEIDLANRIIQDQEPDFRYAFADLARTLQELIADDQKVVTELPSPLQEFLMNEISQMRVNGLALRVVLTKVQMLLECVKTPQERFGEIQLSEMTDVLEHLFARPQSAKPDKRDSINVAAQYVSKYLEIAQVLAAKGRLLHLQQMTLTFLSGDAEIEKEREFLSTYSQRVGALSTLFTIHSNAILSRFIFAADLAGVDSEYES